MQIEKFPIDFVGTDRLPIYKHFNDNSVKAQFASKNFSKSYRFLSSLINVIFCIILLAIFIPAIPVVWFFNSLLCPGPLFYTQIRVGKHGKLFKIYKFRSMIVNAEANGKPQFTTHRDSRVTCVGKVMRMLRIDEVPQVINICKGEMCFIGPRPERPEFVNLFIAENPDYALRHTVKPGITGWAQIKYKYTSNMKDGLVKLQYDLEFIQKRNLLMDIEIIKGTVFTVIGVKGI